MVDFENFNLNLANFSLKRSKKDRHRLYRKLQGMLEMNEPLPRSLERLWYNASNAGKKPSNGHAVIVKDWLEKNRQGYTFSECISDSLPMRDLMLVRAGEEAGSVPSALAGIIVVDESSKEMKKAISEAVTYPIFMILLLCGVLYMFGVTLIEPLRQSAPPEVFQQIGGLALISDIVKNQGIFIFFGLIGFGVFVAMTMPAWRGKVRAKLDMFPPYSWYRIWQGAAFLLGLSALLKSQVPVVRALEILTNGASPWLKERLDMTREEVMKGSNMGEALREINLNFPDPQIAIDLEILAERADIARVLEQLTHEWLRENTERLQLQAKFARTIGIGLVGTLIAYSMMSIIGLTQQMAQG